MFDCIHSLPMRLDQGLKLQTLMNIIYVFLHLVPSASNSSNEKLWLEERAEVSSRWSWLQLRLAELEARVQQLVELHKHIRSTKV